MRYEAYYNLHRQCLSARPIGGRVQHYQFLCLSEAQFAVQPAGRQRVLEEQKKNVHAFVRGELVTWGDHRVRAHPYDGVDSAVSVDTFRKHDGYQEVTYDPYQYESFVLKHDESPIYQAHHAWVIGKHIFAYKYDTFGIKEDRRSTVA